jgi:hypothetical protein
MYNDISKYQAPGEINPPGASLIMNIELTIFILHISSIAIFDKL